MNEVVNVALVGIAGYGYNYVNRLLDESEGKNVRIVAAVDPYPQKCKRLQDLKNAGAKLYSNLEEFYNSGGKAELVIISSPIHFHASQAILALKNDSNVLCEKPVAATIQDAIEMAETEDKTGKIVAIGYQWSYTETIQAVKRDVISGLLGKPIRFKTFISWPRPASYYTERKWSAAIKSQDGAWVLDSPVHNATAHYIHNCFYILGKTREISAMPRNVQAELYRANSISNYDTAALRVYTQDGVEILHFVSHAVPSDIGPIISYEFEHANVIYERLGGNNFIARFKDGRTKNYGDPEDGGKAKLWMAIESVRTGRRPFCDIKASIPQLLCANGAQESMEVVNFPEKLIKKQGSQGDTLTFVNGLQSVLIQCFNLGILPYEHGNIEWSRKSKTINLRDYHRFPSYQNVNLI